MKWKSRMLWSYSPIPGLLFLSPLSFANTSYYPLMVRMVWYGKGKKIRKEELQIEIHQTRVMQVHNLFWITWARMTFPA
jgi:hypothetical protein